MQLPFFELLYQLSIRSLFEKFLLQKYLLQCLIPEKLICQSCFLDYAILQSNDSQSIQMKNLLLTLSDTQNIIISKMTF